MPRNDITADILRDLYIKKLLSKNEIALELKCHITTIHKKMREFHIPVRKQPLATQIAMNKRIIRINRSDLEHLYLEEKLSILKIAQKLKFDTHTINRELLRHNIFLRTKAEAIRLALSKKKIPRETLEVLYNKFQLTQKRIAEKLGKSRGYILYLMKYYEIPTRNSTITQTHYPKFNFSQNLLEKSYLIGFRIGDLNVKLSPSGNLVLVNCTSTKRVQVELFKKLFGKYGFVWVSKLRKDKNRVFMTRLNHTFDFLLPKKDEIPAWILKEGKYFIPFLAGYTDAEGCIGVFNKLARFTLSSYDENLLKQSYRKLNNLGIPCNPPRLLVKKGHIKSDGLIYRKDHWSFTIVKKNSLLLLFQAIEPYLKHEKRINDLKKAKANIIQRNLRLFTV